MPLPKEVENFVTPTKHTLFGPYSEQKTMHEEINDTLDVRLYPVIRDLIKQNPTTVFTGSRLELQEYTKSQNEMILTEIEIPSSVKFYISTDNAKQLKVYLAGLVSQENLTQQLITLKLANIDLSNIAILGDQNTFITRCNNDLVNFKQSLNQIANKNVLIVAGCGLETMVTDSLKQVFSRKLQQESFTGNLLSATYAQSEHAPNLGFIVLNLNYGEICESQIAFFLEHFNCISVFSGSAAGYIASHSNNQPLPDIGTRISVANASHYDGSKVLSDKSSKSMHHHVPTIYVESFEWLEKIKSEQGQTVDVETYYILRAANNFLSKNPHKKLHLDLGVFISDYVGIKPLREYSKVFEDYPKHLNTFIQQTLKLSLNSTYNNNKNTIPTFDNGYYSLRPKAHTISTALNKEAVIECIGKKWDQSEFNKRCHTPVQIGKVSNHELFGKRGVQRCLHLPIKLPNSEIVIPEEYQHFSQELQKIFDFESSINPNWQEQYAYLTVDQSFIPRSNFQRVPGPHVDGIPRDKKNPGNQKIDHSYLITNAIPTRFYPQKFNMDQFDLGKHHFFAIFRALCDEFRTIELKLNTINLMNAYSVHTPTQTLEDVWRTFIRLEFSTLKFDRSGNSINPYFAEKAEFSEYPFAYRPRPIPAHLTVPPSVYLDKPVTHKTFTKTTLDEFGRALLKAALLTDKRYVNKWSDYKDLDQLANDIMDERNQGIIITKDGIPHAFFLYKISPSLTIELETLFTFMVGKGNEAMIYGMKSINKISNKFALMQGKKQSVPLVIQVNDNNQDMIKFFLRAARLAKIGVVLQGYQPKNNCHNYLETVIDSGAPKLK